jgi:NADH-quinone oxidoreductase subunit L
MFIGVGLGAYGASLFHLMTHAFFKALLFMAAGLVIHALSDEQDIRRMGGLGRELPWTYRAFLVGSLALAAIPPFAGFFSKDAILSSAIDSGGLGWALWAVGVVGAFLTGLYTFRLLFIVFFGEMSAFAREHLHRGRFEGPLAMMWPVGVLSVLSIVGGFLQVPGAWSAVDEWIDPVAESIPEASGALAVFSILAALAASVAGIGVAWALYKKPSEKPAEIRRRYAWGARLLEKKFYFDEAYNLVFYEPASRLATWLLRRIEGPVILRSLGGLGTGVRDLSGQVSAAQTGRVRAYALALALGLAVLAVVFLIAS